MKRNFLLMLLLTLLPFAGWGQTAIEVTDAAGLAEAFATGGDFKLMSDIQLTSEVNVTRGKTVNLDLNGYTISYTGTYINTGVLGVPRGAALTVDDNSTDKNGSIDGGNNAMVGIAVSKKGDQFVNGTNGEEFTEIGDAVLTVEDGWIRGDKYGISGNGLRNGSVVTINGGHILAMSETDGVGIYNPQSGTLTITGGEITGYNSAVEVRSGSVDVTITAGTLTATCPDYSVTATGNGTTTIGAALAIAQHTTNQPISVTIGGGTFVGARSFSVANPQNTTANVAVEVTDGKFNGPVVITDDRAFNSLKGGVYTDAPDAEYVAEGNTIVDNDDDIYIKAIVPANASWSWTMQPTSSTYNGLAQKPTIRVFELGLDGKRKEVGGGYIVKYFANKTVNDEGVVSFNATDFETAEEVEELYHAGTYWVQVYYEAENENEQNEPIYDPLPGNPKKFTINKYTIQISLQKLDLEYGTPLESIQPVYQVDPKANDKTLEQTIGATGINRYSYEVKGLGNVRADEGWTADALIPDAENAPIYNYAITSADADHKVYVKEQLFDEYGEYTGDAFYDNYAKVTTSRQSAYVNSVKGNLTVYVDAESFRKRYGDDDPDYNAVYQNTDESEPTYTEDETLVGKPAFYTSKNQAGNDVPVTLYRPDYRLDENGEYTDVDEDVDPKTEAIGNHDLDIDLTKNLINNKPLTSYYNITFAYEESGEKPFLNIYPYDITNTDGGNGGGNGGNEGDGGDETPAPEEDLFEVIMPDLVYNAEYQYADPMIVFHHQVLGDINLTETKDITDGDDDDAVTKTVIVGYQDDDLENLTEVEKTHKFTNGTKELFYSKWTNRWNGKINNALAPWLTGMSTEEIKAAADFADNRNVARNEETAAVEDGATIKVHAIETQDEETGEYTSRFIGVRTTEFGIDPYELKVKVKGGEIEWSSAYPNFGIAIDGENDIYAKETETEQTRIVTDLGTSVQKYETAADETAENTVNYEETDPATAYGYRDYDGKTGEYKDLYVYEKAQTAKNVIFAASNYTLVFGKGDATVTPVPYYFLAIDQRIKYANVVQADNKYLAPDATTKTWTNLGEGKSVDLTASTTTVKVYKDAEMTQEVDMTSAEIAKYVTLSCTTTKVGTTEEAIKINQIATVGMDIHTENGDLTIEPLTEIRLAYDNVEQALQDHKGYGAGEGESMKVYLPSRRLKTNTWYSMVLPFRFYVPTFSNKLNYASVALLKETTSGNDVHFNTNVGWVEANTPFLFKVAPGETNFEDATTWNAEDLADVCFENVKIGDNFDYNGEEDPFVETHEGGVKFIGSYKTLEYLEVAKSYIAKKGMEPNEWFVSTADGNFYRGNESNKNHNILTTEAYLSFPEGVYEARIFIEDEDGNATAIYGIDAEPAEIAASKNAEGIYNLAGQRVSKAQKGIFIKDGKKVLVK